LAGGVVLAKADSFALTRGQRRWWLLSLCVVLAERALTFGYFIPTMLEMMQGDLLPGALRATFDMWQLLNYLRHLFNLCAWLCALAALTAQRHGPGRTAGHGPDH
jgi:hypothetical protein